MTGIRLTEEQNYKIRYIAEMNHRKINDEFKLMVENHIKQYEQNYGIIEIENQENATTPKNNIETLINSGNVIVGDNSTINM